jgi:hypothetical protein
MASNLPIVRKKMIGADRNTAEIASIFTHCLNDCLKKTLSWDSYQLAWWQRALARHPARTLEWPAVTQNWPLVSFL